MPRYLVEMKSLQVSRDRVRQETLFDGRPSHFEAKGTCTMSNVKQDPTVARLTYATQYVAAFDDAVWLAAKAIGDDIPRTQQFKLLVERPILRPPHPEQNRQVSLVGNFDTTVQYFTWVTLATGAITDVDSHCRNQLSVSTYRGHTSIDVDVLEILKATV